MRVRVASSFPASGVMFQYHIVECLVVRESVCLPKTMHIPFVIFMHATHVWGLNMLWLG